MTSDVSDQATELEETMNQQARARQRAWNVLQLQRLKNKPQAINCTDCGDPIPPKRRAAVQGCTRCLQCEQAEETRSRGQR